MLQRISEDELVDHKQGESWVGGQLEKQKSLMFSLTKLVAIIQQVLQSLIRLAFLLRQHDLLQGGQLGAEYELQLLGLIFVGLGLFPAFLQFYPLGLVERPVLAVAVPEAVDFSQEQCVLLLEVQVLTVQNLLDGLVFAEEAFGFAQLAPALDVLAFAVVAARGGMGRQRWSLGGGLRQRRGHHGRDVGGRSLLVEEGLSAGCVVGGVLGLGEGERGAKDVGVVFDGFVGLHLFYIPIYYGVSQKPKRMNVCQTARSLPCPDQPGIPPLSPITILILNRRCSCKMREGSRVTAAWHGFLRPQDQQAEVFAFAPGLNPETEEGGYVKSQRNGELVVGALQVGVDDVIIENRVGSG